MSASFPGQALLRHSETFELSLLQMQFKSSKPEQLDPFVTWATHANKHAGGVATTCCTVAASATKTEILKIEATIISNQRVNKLLGGERIRKDLSATYEQARVIPARVSSPDWGYASTKCCHIRHDRQIWKARSLFGSHKSKTLAIYRLTPGCRT